MALNELPLADRLAAWGRLWRWRGVLLISAIVTLLYGYFFLNRAYVEVVVSVDHATVLEILWEGEGEKFSRDRMGRIHIGPDQSEYGFFIGDLRRIKRIRLDPLSSSPGSSITIKRLSIRQAGMPTVEFAAADSFAAFEPAADIGSASFSDQEGWRVTSFGRNPHFHLPLDAGPRRLDLPQESLRLFAIVLLVNLLLHGFAATLREHGYVCLLLAGVFIAVAVMAVTTRDNHHPDEMVHVAASAYYRDHWLMPQIESPEIAPTYSIYGVSRLNTREICYLFMGKTSWLLDNLHFRPYLSYRIFNVLLLGVFVFLAWRAPIARLLFAPFLMTPQAWYLFAYCNSDAFALFLTTVVAYQLVFSESLFNQFLRGRGIDWSMAARIGALMGGLFLVKINYYFFLVFLGGYFVLGFLFQRLAFSRTILVRLLLVLGLGIGFFAIRQGADVYVNGFDKSAKLSRIMEERTTPMYNPTTPLDKQHPNLRMQARGVSIAELLGEQRWFGKTVRSFLGVYGYMGVSSSSAYYNLVTWVWAGFLGYLLLAILFGGGWWQRALLGHVLACCLALIAMACYNAWVNDFQAQGRHILVMLPMIGVLMANMIDRSRTMLLHGFVLTLFFLSMYSFLFVGLLETAKFGIG